MHLGRGAERFADRVDAGRALGALVAQRLGGHDNVLVLGLPRGGVPVAAQVARAIGAELDVLLVRKIGVPGQPELAMGAVAAVGSGDPNAVEVVTNEAVVDRLRIPDAVFRSVLDQELVELRRRSRAYRGDRPAPTVAGRTVIVVDDGLATGSTMRAAAAAVRRRGPARLLVAVPVGAADTCDRLRGDVDDVICARVPRPFRAVHQGYDDFRQTTDEEVLAALAYDLERMSPPGDRGLARPGLGPDAAVEESPGSTGQGGC
jgi:putative phosphoribosyl transferase